MSSSAISSGGAMSSPVDPLSAASIQGMVPDVAAREVYLCGPVRMMQRTAAAIEGLGVPAARIHQERFDG